MTHPNHRLLGGPMSTRRAFITVAGSALMLGFAIKAGSDRLRPPAEFAPNGFVRVESSGAVRLIIPQAEMGQGVYTALAMILAEELDAEWTTVRVEPAPANEALYTNPLLSIQATGNSNSVRAFWTPLRKAGAAARALLVQAAAEDWKVPAGECATEAGAVVHAATGRRASYGALAVRAGGLRPPADPPLKRPADFRLIGRPLPRIDAPEKIDGRAVYGIDVAPNGVLVATLAQSPVLGGRLARVSDAKARATPGVRQVVVLDDAVAVVGDHMWAAKNGLEALEVAWTDGPNGGVSTADVWAALRRASTRPGAPARVLGDPGALPGPGDHRRAYEMPLLAHACMEPLNCTVHVREGEADVWIGTQAIGRVRDAVAEGAGVPPDKVTVHNHLIGGGFGRRLEADMAQMAARIARGLDRPVKVVWTREEDMRHDIYRPAYRDVLSARLEGGRIRGWRHHIAGSAILARFLPPAYRNGVDPDAVDGAAEPPYAIPNLRVEFAREEPPGVRTGFWRGVGPNNNVFAIECFMDELARLAGEDPASFRRAHLEHNPRLRAALDLVLERSGWGEALPSRVGRGLAVQTAFGSHMATVVEAEVDNTGEVRVRRVTAAVDPGLAVNPDTIVAQIQGGLIFGLGAALHGEITLENGRVQQSNFHDYRVPRINEVPPIEVRVIPSSEAPGGIGEAGTTAAPPALRNAIYAATGTALHRLPIEPARLTGRG